MTSSRTGSIIAGRNRLETVPTSIRITVSNGTVDNVQLKAKAPAP